MIIRQLLFVLLVSGFCFFGLSAQGKTLSGEERKLEQQALYSLNNGDEKKAEKFFKKLVRAYPNHARHYNNLGLLYIQTNRAKQGLFILKKGLKRNRKSAQLIMNVGVANMALGNFKKGEVYFLKAAKASPNNPNIYASLGFLYSEMNQYQKAIKNFNKSLSLNPKNVKVFLNRGVMYAKIGKGLKDPKEKLKYNKQAGEDWRRALILDPSVIKYLKQLVALNHLDFTFKEIEGRKKNRKSKKK